MRTIIAFLAISFSTLRAADAPLVEKYLHSGDYANGEQAMIRALATEPDNDQLRVGLGFLQVFRSVDRLGKSLYEYGVKSEGQHLPFIRLPVPKNPNSTPVTYSAFRRVLEVMYHDLETAEATLAGVKDDHVRLPLRLSPIHFDFDGDGMATETLQTVLRTLLQTDFQFLKQNTDFLVCFDRGDVAWLRGYCHLLMGMIDFLLAFDLEDEFDSQASSRFSGVKRRKAGLPASRGLEIRVKEATRLGILRKHLLAVCRLNRETWRYIRAETDDDYEWLPNAKQKSVIGLPVTDEQISTWLEMMEQFEGLLEGKRVIAQPLLRFLWPDIEGGLNVRKLLDDPPAKFDFAEIQTRGINGKYLDKRGEDFNLDALMRVARFIDNPLGLSYMAWFN